MKTICERCKGTGTIITLSGGCACDSCCGVGHFGEDDSVIAARKAKIRRETRQVTNAVLTVVTQFTSRASAMKIVAKLRRKKLLVPQSSGRLTTTPK